MKHRRYIPITSRRNRRRIRVNRGQFLIYLMICLILISIGQIRMPDWQPTDTGPGIIRELAGKDSDSTVKTEMSDGVEAGNIPEYNGKPYIEVNDNIPDFSGTDKEVLSSPGYEYYSALDILGRCGYAEACVGQETMPESDREEIWEVHPSGWRSGQGWERCHIIGFQLTGENANDHNLITGTHSFNVDGMLPFENEVASAAWKGKHVMYRVTPVYKGNELICRGVHMMGQSVEDNSVSFNVFVFNSEPGKTIDYISGLIY